MYFEQHYQIEKNQSKFDVTYMVGDQLYNEFEYLQHIAKQRNADKAIRSNDDEYFMCAVVNGEPAYSCTAVNGGKYNENVIRCCTKFFANPKYSKLTPWWLLKKIYLDASNILFSNDCKEMKKYDFYFISRNPGENISKTLFPKQSGWVNDDPMLYLVGKRPEDPYSWRYIYYRGDIKNFDRPRMSIQEYVAKFNQYVFNTDWTKSALENTKYLFENYGTPKSVLEIGTFEGRYALWLADNYVDMNIDTVDPFDSSIYELEQSYFDHIEKNWQNNLSICKNKKNIHFHKQSSSQALKHMLEVGKKFDFVYVDGDHRSNTVSNDLELSYDMLLKGGIILIDDANSWQSKNYNTNETSTDINLTPKPAVDGFIKKYSEYTQILSIPKKNQVAIRKIK